ncbi:hypothetical protein RJ855_34110, partial [Pseudomonas aeruginosa]
MSYLPIRVWTDFQSAVRLLSAEASPKEVLDLILNWIKRNRKFFLSGSFAVYGFEEFLGLSGEEMPVNFSNFSSSELENFKKFTFKYQALNSTHKCNAHPCINFVRRLPAQA